MRCLSEISGAVFLRADQLNYARLPIIMPILIHRLDRSLPLPKYETPGACAFDLPARETTMIEPHALGFIPMNVIVQTPPGLALLIVPRSSTPRKKGLLSPHGFGLIDQDYCGPEDEIKFQVYNFTDRRVIVEKGERVAQALFVRIDKVDFEEVKIVEEKNRGGFGSTGK